MSRPRLLLLTDLTELEWAIRPLLEEWADVASFDAPGVGDEPPSDLPVIDGIARRALAEIDRRGWDECVFVADEMAIVPAVLAAAARPEAVAALALGHACLRYEATGEEATIRADVFDAWMQTLRSNYAMLVRQDIKSWDTRLDAIRDEEQADALVERWLARVRPQVAEHVAESFLRGVDGLDLEPLLRQLDRPMLFAEHTDCIGWTPHSFAEATAAFPTATAVGVPAKPAVSPEFAEALRAFCEQLGG